MPISCVFIDLKSLDSRKQTSANWNQHIHELTLLIIHLKSQREESEKYKNIYQNWKKIHIRRQSFVVWQSFVVLYDFFSILVRFI